MDVLKMPKIDVSYKDLCSLIGRKISPEQISDELLYAKSELDGVDGDILKIDIKDTNRPDLWSAEGIAREIRARYRPGMPKYAVKKSGMSVIVDGSVNNVRPFTACAIVKGIRITSSVMSQLLQLQEKVAGTFGRNRKEVAIGVYDLDKIKFPVTFKAMKPEDIRFVPLASRDKMSAFDIIKKHPKGKEFGHLLDGKGLCPVFADADEEILSVPPIINSNHSGNVNENTKNLFIECSGFDLRFLNTALNVMVAALSERGGMLYSVNVMYGKKNIATPDLTPKSFSITVDYVNKISGLGLPAKDMSKLLEKSLYAPKISGKQIDVLYPAYRQDIMHERDVIEDIIISYGFNNVKPDSPKLITKGKLTEKQAFIEKVTNIMTGAGFQEILSYTLTSADNLYAKMGTNGNAAEIENPVSANWSVLRTWLLPGLLEFLGKNQHIEYPHDIFETGTCVLLANTETRSRDIPKLAAAVSASTVNYEAISSTLDALFRNLGMKYILKACVHPSFIEGRTAEIIVGNKVIGYVGEIHPQVLNNWSLEKPVVAFEIGLEEIFSALNR